MVSAWGGFSYVCRHIHHLNKHACYNIVCQRGNIQINSCIPSVVKLYIKNEYVYRSHIHTQMENKAWALVCADEARVERCVWTFPPLHCRSGRGARVMQAQAEANSHFPASKSRQLCGVSCPGSRGFPSALQVNTTWPRIHCGGAASTDCGDRLLFSLCFHVEVRALWAFVCGGSWVGVGIQCDTRYKCNYSSRMIRLTKAFFLLILLLSACFTPFYSLCWR